MAIMSRNVRTCLVYILLVCVTAISSFMYPPVKGMVNGAKPKRGTLSIQDKWRTALRKRTMQESWQPEVNNNLQDYWVDEENLEQQLDLAREEEQNELRDVVSNQELERWQALKNKIEEIARNEIRKSYGTRIPVSNPLEILIKRTFDETKWRPDV